MDFVGETGANLQRLACDRGQVTDADDFELLLVAFGHALDHVHQQSTIQAVHGAGLA